MKALFDSIDPCMQTPERTAKIMDFELPVEHQLAYESAFNFARDEIRPHSAEIERTDDFPPWIWRRLAEQGYTGIAIPEEYGGWKGRKSCCTIRVVKRRAVPLPG